MNPSLVFEYRYHDIDILEVCVIASNGAYRGQTNLYVGHDELHDVAKTLAGFPVATSDLRKIELGIFGPECANGALSMSFSCIGGAGRAQIQITLEADYANSDIADFAKFRTTFEPAALDIFVDELNVLTKTLHGKATLMLTPYSLLS